MAQQPFIGEVRMFGIPFAPKGWALCNGQLLPISSNAALFAVIGTTYGGNGTTNFALPNMQGRVGVHPGPGYVLGQNAGNESVSLLSNQISHNHPVASNATANAFAAAGNFPASVEAGKILYGPTADTPMAAAIISPSGGSLPHNNMQPYLVVIYCIALVGIFPVRN
jgi:microcystin-dependent protein